MNTRITAIIPAYNALDFLPGAIASIRTQTFPVEEIIVVDDGSADGTADYAASLPGVHFIRQENAGPAAARNTALKVASGDFVAFLDADDRWPADKLETQLERFHREPELMVVSGRVQYRFLTGAPIERDEELKMRRDNSIIHVHLGAALFRREAFETVGLFDPSFRFHEDQDWFLRFKESGRRMAILDEITLHYQVHGGNMTNGMDMQATGLLRAMKNSLDRRRSRGQREPLPRLTDYRDAAPVSTAPNPLD